MSLQGYSLLQRCALALSGRHEATVKFLEMYWSMLPNRLLEEPPFRGRYVPSSIMERAAFLEWETTSMLSKNSPDWPKIFMFPSFTEIGEDLLRLLKAHRGQFHEGDYEWLWVEENAYFGLPCLRAHMMVFEELQNLPCISPWVTELIRTQPKCVDTSRTQAQQVEFRSQWGLNILPDMHSVINGLHIDQDAIAHVIEYFAPLVLTTANYVLYNMNHLTTQEKIDDEIAQLVQQHRITVSNPLSTIPLAVRQQLAHIDLSGIFYLLLDDIAGITTHPADYPISEWKWRLFHKFVQGLLQTARLHGETCMTFVKANLESHGMADLLDPTALPVPGWICNDFVDLLGEYDDGQDEDSEEEVDYDDLPDVCFEPAGPEIRVENIAKAVCTASDLPEPDCSICRDDLDVSVMIRTEVPLKLRCGHCLHYGCLHTLINGVSEFSNRCPNCREEIAPRRAKRLKDVYLLSTTSTPDPSNMAQANNREDKSSDLQDKDGDVVMTDD